MQSVLTGAAAPPIGSIPVNSGRRNAALSATTTDDVAHQEPAPTSPKRWHCFRALTPIPVRSSRKAIAKSTIAEAVGSFWRERHTSSGTD